MNAGEDNMFNVNNLSWMPRYALFISPMALKRLIGVRSNGWLEDEVINFMSELCNFYSAFIPETENFKEDVPSCVIGKAGDDNRWINPSYSGQFKVINGNIPTSLTTDIDREKFVYELETW